MTSPNPYRGFRFPAEVIEHAVWLYHCFSLSLRYVETILAARGVVMSYESIREWRPALWPAVRQHPEAAQAKAGRQVAPGWCVTNTIPKSELWSRMRDEGGPPRRRQSGAGVKPLQAAVVKSDGGERCSKRRDLIPSGVVRRGERERTADDVSKCQG